MNSRALSSRAFAEFNLGRYERALALFRQAGLPVYAAHCLQSLGRPAEAAAELKREARRRPGRGVWLELGRVLRAQGRLSEAAAALRRAGAKADLSELLRQRAQACAGAARLKLLEEAARLAPGGPACAELAGALAARSRRLPHARAAVLLRRAMALAPRDLSLRRELSELLRLRARLGGGEKALREALRLDPLNPEARKDVVDLLRPGLAHGGPDEVLRGARGLVNGDPGLRRDLRRALEREARLLKSASRRGDAFRELVAAGDYERAFALGESILDDGPTLHDLRAFVNPWDSDELPKLRARHVELLSALLSAGKGGPWPWMCRGFLLGREGLEDFEKLRRWPLKRYGWMYYRAGQQSLCQRRYAEAVRRLRLAARHRPADWRVHGYLAEARLCLGEGERALEEMEKARALAPAGELRDVLAWRGLFALWLGRYEEARELLQWAAALGGEHARAWLGGALLMLGKTREALAELRRALSEEPRNREGRVWLGEALRLLGRHKEAVLELSRPPLGMWALFNRALSRRALGDGKGFDEDCAAIAPSVLRRVAERAGLDPALKAEALEAGLKQARGFRHDDYAYDLWLK